MSEIRKLEIRKEGKDEGRWTRDDGRLRAEIRKEDRGRAYGC
jgi:hypothetical protein